MSIPNDLNIPDDRRPVIEPPRFHLSTLMYGVALICGMLAAMLAIGPYAAFALLLGILTVVAHVAGSALGTRLRQHGDTPLGGGTSPTTARRNRSLNQSDFAPPTQLGRRESLGLVTLLGAVLGALIGGAAGSLLLLTIYWEQANIYNIGAGALACAALGSMAGFIASSFLQVACTAWKQAAQTASQDRRAKRA